VDVLRHRRASAYGAGPGIDAALDSCRRLATYGIAATIGYAPRPGEPARAAADQYLAAFERLSGADLDCYVSVKLSAIGFDPALYEELAVAAAASRRRLHLDALRPATAEATFALLERPSALEPAFLGTTLPGRWRRSLRDAERAARLGLTVRVVKGHWDDEVGGSVDPSRGFLAVVDRLAGHPAGVAVATHDVRLLREAIRRLTRSATPCGVELFLGMPFGPPAAVARDAGVPIRVYVPYGDAWPGYGVAGVVRRPASAWWLVQDLLLGSDKTWRSIRRSRRKS
jgi:proline dehydrogenase